VALYPTSIAKPIPTSNSIQRIVAIYELLRWL
jgi:hypothetical protein